jgi:hypothetical protein
LIPNQDVSLGRIRVEPCLDPKRTTAFCRTDSLPAVAAPGTARGLSYYFPHLTTGLFLSARKPTHLPFLTPSSSPAWGVSHRAKPSGSRYCTRRRKERRSQGLDSVIRESLPQALRGPFWCPTGETARNSGMIPAHSRHLIQTMPSVEDGFACPLDICMSRIRSSNRSAIAVRLIRSEDPSLSAFTPIGMIDASTRTSSCLSGNR